MRLLLPALTCCLLACAAHGMFMQPELVPVGRLLRSAERYLAKHPQQVGAHYQLGRVHYVAFSAGRRWIPGATSDGDRAVWVGEPPFNYLYDNQSPLFLATMAARYSPADALAHASLAAAEFKEALRLESSSAPSQSALYQLGLASLMDEVLKWLPTVRNKLKQVPPPWDELNTGKVRTAYTKALRSGMVEDRKLTVRPSLDSVTSQEAANALIRLSKQEPKSLTKNERSILREAEGVERHFANMKDDGTVTPIVLSLNPADHLDDMLARDNEVDFDLRGFGPHERWSWIKPELGLLVWDPMNSGQITSARQLFGGYTFEQFHADGYVALASLDDNYDGKLSGEELRGIRVWFDRNSDGISTPDEVVSLEELGIESIATHSDGKDGIHLKSSVGVMLRDGRSIPTWDWFAKPIARASGNN